MVKRHALVLTAALGAALLSTAALAGQCPAGQIGTDVTKPVTTETKGVADTVLSAIDLSQEPANTASRVSSELSNQSPSTRTRWRSSSGTMKTRPTPVRRLACRSPSLRTFRARKGSRMRSPIRKPWIPKHETLFCTRSHVRAAGWMRSSPARPHRWTKSLLPKVSPSAMSAASCHSRFFPRRSSRRSPTVPLPLV